MPISSKRIKNIAVSFSILTILTLATVGYFYFYVQSKEEVLHAHHYRVLNQIGRNVKALYSTYLSNAENNAPTDLIQLKQQAWRLAEKERIPPSASPPPIAIKKEGFANAATDSQKIFLRFDEFENRFETLTKLKVKIFPDSSFSQEIFHRTPSGWEFSYTKILEGQRNGTTSNNFYTISLNRPVKKLMADVLRPEVFEELLVFQMVDGAFQKVYQAGEMDIFSWGLNHRLDSLLKMQLKGGQCHLLTGLPYVIYLRPLPLAEGKELFLCGLVDEKRFRAEKMRIPPLMAILISLAAVLILLAFPTLKLRLMSSYDTLDVPDMLLSLLSIIMGTYLLVLLLFGSYRYIFDDDEKRKRYLIDFHHRIEAAFLDEVDSICQQLIHYNSLDTNDWRKSWSTPEITSVLSKREDPRFPSVYPFFRTVFWVNADETIGNEITISEHVTPKISLSDRRYLELLKKGEGWQVPRGEKRDRFMMESIFSRTSGTQYAAFSINSKNPHTPIIALISDLYSVNRAVLPQSYGFCIIDPSGLVWFHSDHSRNLQENFIEECRNPNLRSAMFSHTPLYDSGAYMGRQHTFYMEPIDDLPLFLIVFENSTYFRGAHAQVMSFNFFFAVVFILTAMLFLAFLYFWSTAAFNGKQSNLMLDWLRPSSLNRKKYLYLVSLNGVLLISLILFTRNAPFHLVKAVHLVFISNFFAFASANILLRHRSSGAMRSWQNWMPILGLGFAFAVLNWVSYYTSTLSLSAWWSQIGSFQLVPLVLLLVLWSSGRSKGMLSSRWLTRISASFDTPTAYRLFLMSWLGISSIFPAIRLYQISYNIEQQLLMRRAQVQLTVDIRQRREWIDRQYQDIRVHQGFPAYRLKSRGVFTEPYLNVYSLGLQGGRIYGNLEGIDLELKPGSLQKLWSRNRGGAPGSPRLCLDSVYHFEPVNSKAGADTSKLELAVIWKDSCDWQCLDSRYAGEAEEQASFATYLISDVKARLDAQRVGVRKNDTIEMNLGKLRKPIKIRLKFPPHTKKGNAGQKAVFAHQNVLPWFRLPFDNTVRETNLLSNYRSADASWVMKTVNGHLYCFAPSSDLVIRSKVPSYTFPSNSEKSILFWVFFGLLIALVYKLLDYHVNHLFGQGILDPNPLSFQFNLELLFNTDEPIFLVVPPAPISGLYREILDLKAKSIDPESSFLMIDLLEEDAEKFGQKDFSEIYSTIVLTHFDQDVRTLMECEKRMDILARYLKKYPDRQLILLSHQGDLNIRNLVKSEKLSNRPRESFRELRKWRQLLSPFVKIILPCEKWTYLTSTERLMSFLKESGPAFLQIAPSSVTNGRLKEDHILSKIFTPQHHFQLIEADKPEKEGPPANGQRVLLFDGEQMRRSGSITDRQLADRGIEGIKRMHFEKCIQVLEKGESVHILSTVPPLQLLEILKMSEGPASQAVDVGGWKAKLKKNIAERKKGLVLLETVSTSPEEIDQQIVMKECCNGDSLQRLHSALIRLVQKMELNKNREDRERAIVRQVEIMARLYYLDIWTRCSEEEQFMLYDLAKDGIANSKNEEGFIRLQTKGLIVSSGNSPHIMNKSFRDFILHTIQPAEALEMVKKRNREGDWNQIRNPIIVIILILSGFIIFTQKEFIDDTLAFFAAVGAIIPIIQELIFRITAWDATTFNWPFFGKKPSSDSSGLEG